MMNLLWKRFVKSTLYCFLLVVCGLQVLVAQSTSTSSTNDLTEMGKNIPDQQLDQVMLYGTVKTPYTSSQEMIVHVYKRDLHRNSSNFLDSDQILKDDGQTKVHALEDPNVTFKFSEIKKGARIVALGKYNDDKTFYTVEVAVWSQDLENFRGMGLVHPSVNTLLKETLNRIDLLDPNAYKKRKDQLTKIAAFAGKIGDINGLVIATVFKADADIQLKEPSFALNELLMALAIREATGNLYATIPISIKIITIERGLGQNDKVIRDAKSALKTIEKVEKSSNPNEDIEVTKKAWSYDILNHMHNVYIAQKQYKEARTVAEQSLKIAAALKKPNFQAAANASIANAVIGMNDFEGGRDYLYSAYSLLDPSSAGYTATLMWIYAIAYVPAPELAEKCYEQGTQGASESILRMWERVKSQLQQATEELMQVELPSFFYSSMA